MQITNIKLIKSQFADSGAKAFGQLELDNAIVLDIEVREHQGRPWVAFPGYKTIKDKQTGQDKKQSRVFIKDESLRNAINNEVIGKYSRDIHAGAANDNSGPSVGGTNGFPF